MDLTVLLQICFYLGVGLGLSGSAWGLAISFQAALGIGKDKFFAVLPLAVLPSTQGIYSLLGGILKKPELSTNPTVGALLLLVGTACLLSAIYQGKVCAAGVRAIGEGRNTLGNGIIAAAMPETYAVFSFVCLFLL
ncbi:MAG: ATPase [Pseudomonadota bacterium]